MKPTKIQATTDDVVFLEPEMADFEVFATPFNARLEILPALIAVCKTEVGVQKAVELAADRNLRITIKSGGHSFEGFSLNTDGLVLDVSLMNEQKLVDGVYHAGPGVKLRQAYEFLLPQKRIVPLGSFGTMGLSGLVLGGGYGMFAQMGPKLR